MIELERKRIHSNTSLLAASGIDNLIYVTDESNGVNVHGMRLSAGFEPDSTDANGHLIWALLCIPDEASAIPNIVQSALEAELSNAFIWAAGVLFFSNQTSANMEVVLKSTRNCQNGARIVFQHFIEGLTAGSVRGVKIMQCFTKSL